MSKTEQLHGLTEEHLTRQDQFLIHKDCQEDFIRLKKAAAAAGIRLKVASAFRSFERQLLLWTEKALGKRAVLDDGGKEVATSGLSEGELLCKMLRWSALPGFSRHHWGTDFDVYDDTPALTPCLVPKEYAPGGPFARLAGFLAQEGHGFYLPYARDKGGVAVEPWHISHRDTALAYEKLLNMERVERFLSDPPRPIALSEVVLDQLPDIFERFIRPPA